MALLDVDRLLEPVSDESPCGPNLEYDDRYMAFERAYRGKPETQFSPAEPPDWPEVYRLGAELVEQSKDLRIVCQLGRGVLHTKDVTGLTDFAASLALVRGYIERYWPIVHPQLDPADDNDPTIRVNTVASLSDHATTIQSLRAATMVALPGLGRFSLRDWQVATGAIPAGHVEDPSKGPPNLSTIETAFTGCSLDELKANYDAVRQCRDHVEAIDSSLTAQVGASRSVSLDDLRSTLSDLLDILAKNLRLREPSIVVEGINGQPAGDPGAVSPGQSVSSGEIRSREDVVAALERICEYYKRFEPSSPLPLLLTGAKRLATKSFLEIVKDLTPEAVAQMRKISGVTDATDDDD